jgi:hypothetical protein
MYVCNVSTNFFFSFTYPTFSRISKMSSRTTGGNLPQFEDHWHSANGLTPFVTVECGFNKSRQTAALRDKTTCDISWSVNWHLRNFVEPIVVCSSL